MSQRQLQKLYLKTVVSIEEDGLLVPASNSRCVAQGVVHVLTAWNPGDERPSREENEGSGVPSDCDEPDGSGVLRGLGCSAASVKTHQ